MVQGWRRRIVIVAAIHQSTLLQFTSRTHSRDETGIPSLGCAPSHILPGDRSYPLLRVPHNLGHNSHISAPSVWRQNVIMGTEESSHKHAREGEDIANCPKRHAPASTVHQDDGVDGGASDDDTSLSMTPLVDALNDIVGTSGSQRRRLVGAHDEGVCLSQALIAQVKARGPAPTAAPSSSSHTRHT